MLSRMHASPLEPGAQAAASAEPAALAGRASQLSRAKRQATGLLLAVVVVFALTYFFPPSLGVACVRAVA